MQSKSSVNGIAKPIDVLALQETHDAQANRLALILNDFNPSGPYRVLTNSATRDEMGLIYNENTVSLVNAGLASADPRPAVWAELRPIGYSAEDGTVSFYSFHLKAGGTDSDTARRAASAYHAHADDRGRDNMVYLGDYNIRSSSEGGFANVAAHGIGQAFYPVDRPKTYKINSTFDSCWLTISTATTALATRASIHLFFC